MASSLYGHGLDAGSPDNLAKSLKPIDEEDEVDESSNETIRTDS